MSPPSILACRDDLLSALDFHAANGFFMCIQVLSLEERRGEWGFKALKQMMKILFKLVG